MVQHLECHLLQWRTAPLECCQLFLYSSGLCSWADSLRTLLSRVILNDHEWLQTFLSLFVCSFVRTIRPSGVFTALSGCYVTGATWSCCYLSMFCVHHTTMHQFAVSLHAKPHTKVHVYVAVNCYLYFCQHAWDLLCATAVTRAQGMSRIYLGCTVVYGTCLECQHFWNVFGVDSSVQTRQCPECLGTQQRGIQCVWNVFTLLASCHFQNVQNPTSLQITSA